MGYLERMAVLERSRWLKKPKIWEKPSWWKSEEDKENMCQEVYNTTFSVQTQVDKIHFTTERDIDFERAKAFPSIENQRIIEEYMISDAKSYKWLDMDVYIMNQKGVPYQVAQIISFVWNQNITKYWIDKGTQYENSEVILKLLENALDVYDKFCWWEKDFSQLEELEKHTLVFAWKKWFLWKDISSVLENNICPVDIAKCVTHYIDYDFQDFYECTNELIQYKLW